jgi:phosphonoacetate hydrolase
MNAKSACLDLEQVCAKKGAPIRKAVSTGRDRYMKHHRGCSGAVYIHLKDPKDAPRVREIISGVPGVERILSKEEAAKEFHLMASRIGQLMVIGDKDTVFGELDDEKENFPGLRSHGSLHETDIPLFVYNAKKAPAADYFNHNLDLARWLYPVVA